MYVIKDWHSWNTTRHDYTDTTTKLIPFVFTIKLPSPRYERIIVNRNHQGRILRSVPQNDLLTQKI